MWSTFRSFLGGVVDNSDQKSQIAVSYVDRVSESAVDLGAFGSRDESIRQRIIEMREKLDDVKSLSAEFGGIVGPFEEMNRELSRLTTRGVELEVALNQARDLVSETRRENQGLSASVSALSSDLTAAQGRIGSLEREVNSQLDELSETQILLRDRELKIENLERQLFSELEQGKALSAEAKALRSEVEASDVSLSRSEHDLALARERVNVLDTDNRRMQQALADLSAQVIDLQSRIQEQQSALEGRRQAEVALQERLALEFAARERVEVQLESETTSLRTEKSALGMKLEALQHRLSTTEQILARVRSQFREQDEASRSAERKLKEATIARTTAERRAEALQEELVRQSERFAESQRSRDEVAARSEMLGKAMIAKDAQLVQAASRISGLEGRIEQITSKHETTRSDLEARMARLLEELESERSERALLQGALEIARETRVQLKKQYDAFRKGGRHHLPEELNESSEDGSKNNVHTLTNVKNQIS